MSIDISSLANRTKLSAQSTSRTERTQSAEDRQATRLARREARIQARRAQQTEDSTSTNPSQSQNTAQSTDSSGNTNSQGTTATSAESSSGAKSTNHNFRGDLRGANLVHFAVQGVFRDASGISVFSHGEGPHAIKPPSSSKSENTPNQSNTTPQASEGTNSTIKTVA